MSYKMRFRKSPLQRDTHIGAHLVLLPVAALQRLMKEAP